MPRMQVLTSQLNTAFGPGNIASINAALFDPSSGSTFLGGIQALGIATSAAEAGYINSWPSALLASVQAVVFTDLMRSVRLPITFAWKPGYDFGVEMFDVGSTTTTAGGITVIATSRYPDDPHPLLA